MNKTKEKILQTATRLFHLHGYHATGFSLLIKESGAPKGSIYHHFPNGKEQLAIEAIRLSAEKVAEEIISHLNSTDDPKVAILQHVQNIATRFENFENRKLADWTIVPFGLLAAESSLGNENMRQICNDTYNHWAQLYKEKLMTANYPEQDALNIATAITALIEGAITLSLTSKSNEPLIRIQSMIPLLIYK